MNPVKKKMIADPQIQHQILQLLEDRGTEKSICPSEVAKKLAPSDWRDLMDRVRIVGAELARKKEILITQREHILSPDDLKGPVRFRLPEANNKFHFNS